MGSLNRFRIVWIALGFFFGAMLATEHLMSGDREDFDWGTGKMPVHGIRAAVPRKSWDKFFTQLKTFATTNGFGIRIARIHPVKEQFTIDMWRKDIAASGENVFDPLDFEIDFYVDPKMGGSADTVAPLIGMLKDDVSQVPGATITQTK